MTKQASKNDDMDIDAMLNDIEIDVDEPVVDKKIASNIIKKVATPKGKKVVTLHGKSMPEVAQVICAQRKIKLETTTKDQEAEFEELAARIDELPVKVREKVKNTLYHLTGGTSLSTYTVKAIEHLKSGGSIADLPEFYQKQGYTKGTAAAQAGQMRKLLPIFKITDQSGKLNNDSVIVNSFKK